MTATTFDPALKTNNTLSGGSLVATSTGAGGARSSRRLQGPSYFEMTCTTLTGTPSLGIASLSWNTSTALQSAVNSLGYLASGAVQVNAVTLATIATWAQGDRIDCAVDPANRLIWFRVAGGNWNNNALNDPATGIGGIDYSAAFTQPGTLEAAVYASLTGNVWTAVFSAGSFAGAPPSGFSSLDNVQYVVANDSHSYYQRAFSPAGSLTSVSGIVKELGVPVAGRRVDVYDRLTGELLGTTKSAGDGSWSIPCLGRPTVRVVASDPTAYNSLAYDNVSPA